VKVRELMTSDPVTVKPDATLGAVATLMKQEDCGSIPVVENGALVGILVTAQIAREESEHETGQTIKEISEPTSGRGSHARG
jgi:CBS domain-containing protein